MRYSLADYKLSVSIPQSLRTGANSMFSESTIVIGGQGTSVGSIDVETDNPVWTKSSDASGAVVFEKSYDRSGTVSVSLRQTSDKVLILKKLFSAMYKAETNVEGLTMTLTDDKNDEVCTCTDCVIPDIPAQSFGEKSASQTWKFLVSNIDYNI